MQGVQRLEHHVRVDRGRPVADQARHVVDLLHLTGLRDEPDLETGPLADQVLVDRAHREQRRHRGPLGAEVAVGEDDDVHPARDERGRLGADGREATLHASRPLGNRPRHVDRARLEHRVVDLPELLELRVAQDRLRHDELVAVVGRLAQQVDLGADARLEAHHDRLTQRIDRGVRDLSEQLLEVREEGRALIGQRRERDVVAHRAGGLRRVPCHRDEQDVQVLLGPAESQLLRS